MNSGQSVVAVAGARTAIGTFGGSLKAVPAHELGAAAIKEAVLRSNIEPHEVDEVVLGCVGQVGADAFNARRATLAAGLPIGTTAYNVNRLCGSGLQALWSGATQIATGQSSIVVAGGNENMTRQPFLDYSARDGYRLADRRLVDGTLSLVTDPWGNYPMGVTAEAVARRYDVSRDEQDAFAFQSQERAAQALESQTFAEEIVPVTVSEGKSTRVFDVDEHPRSGTTLEALGRLKPVFMDGGTVTAGNSSGISDAGAALVLMREDAAHARGLSSLGRLAHFATAAIEPEVMGYAPVYAIERVLKQAGLTPANLGVIEINEAFAAQAVAVIRDAGLSPDRVNPNGGAIALGHPVGATGAILALKLLHEMGRRNCEWGLVSMCIGGGQAVAALFQAI
jgi:acetyl-CoA C-acetyltransferase